MNTNSKIHFTTADGSSTLLSAQYGAHYHSLHGAISESMHIFVEAGLMALTQMKVNVLEVGFGTGLNAALTAQRGREIGADITYHALELHPLAKEEYTLLNYSQQLPANSAALWLAACDAPWGEDFTVEDGFTIRKINEDFTQWLPATQYNLVYFDAFAPDDQPEMWSAEQFQKIFNAMAAGGILVTYSVKGTVKRTLRDVGFELERLEGPPGKKHMLRAWKR